MPRLAGARHDAGMSVSEITTSTLARPGARLAYEVAGDGPPVVLVHGFGLDLRMWDPQVEPLAARFRVVRYDCRGFGASGPFDPAVPYTHAGDLLALLDYLAIQDAALVGLSFGGRVVLQTALAAPARVRGLALLGPVLDGMPWDPASAQALEEVTRQVQTRGLLAGRAAWLSHPLFAAARERPDLARHLADMVAGYPGQHWLGQHDVPGFREMSAVLARRIPGARYHVVADAGHMINLEQAPAVNDLLTRFLADLTFDPAVMATAGINDPDGRPR